MENIKGFLTIIEEYIKENNIDLKIIPVNLRSIDNSFLKYINEFFLKVKGDDRIEEYATIKLENNNISIEVKCTSGKKLFINKGEKFIKKSSLVNAITEDTFIKIITLKELDTIEKLQKKYPRYIKEMKDIRLSCKEINNSFLNYCKYIKYLDKERKESLKPSIDEITFMDPDACQKIRSGVGTGKMYQANKHEEISYEEREEVLLNANPKKVIKAKDTSGKDSSCLICLYDIKRLNEASNYVIVMEPINSFKYTKIAFFHTDENIMDIDFKEKAKEYLEYDRETVTSLANMVRNCHLDIDRFKDNMNAILYNNYENINYLTMKRLQLAKENPEKFYNEYDRATAEKIANAKIKVKARTEAEQKN